LSFLEELTKLGLQNFSIDVALTKGMRASVPHRLQFLALEITSNCNLRCIHCYGDFGPVQDDKLTLSIEHQLRILRDAHDLGCKTVQFTGGEPTLSKRLFELIDFAKAVGFKHVIVYTNGTLITEKMAEKFRQREVTVHLSLYSHDQQTHDTITGFKGSFEMTRQGLLLLKQKGVDTAVGTPVMKQNQEDLESVKAFLNDIGIKKHFFDPIRPIGRAKLNIHPDKTEFLDCRFIRKPSFKTSRESYLRFKYGHICWLGCVEITATGDVLPCAFARNLVMGNVRDKPLKEIMENKEAARYWHLSKDGINICRDCEYRYCCFDCRPLAMNERSRLTLRGEYCTYNPYAGVWENWSPILEEIIKRNTLGGDNRE